VAPVQATHAIKHPAVMANAASKALLLLICGMGAQHAAGQDFYYLEAGVAACTRAPAPNASPAAPKAVPRGVAQRGRIHVACGFEQGSYTLALNSSDPGATFSPKTFLVNFGRIAGSGVFTVTFATPGEQRVSVAITSNMGSPAVPGSFVSAGDTFSVVVP
jgi:hypothetical protein